MNKLTFHRRNLPHLYIPSSTYFITFRIKNSIPLEDLLELQNKYEDIRFMNTTTADKHNHDYFFEYDKLLHSKSL